MVTRLRSVATAYALVALMAATSPAQPEPSAGLPPDRFATIHGLLKPRPGESKYLDDLHWVPRLWEARQKAAAEGKLLLLLDIGGPPLGFC